MHSPFGRLEFLLLVILPIAEAISLDANNLTSIKVAARSTAKQLFQLYDGRKPGRPIGLFSDDLPQYEWWLSGAVWAGLIDYQTYTGDYQYSDTIQKALLAQSGPHHDFLPPNQTKTETSGDQAMWALAAMTAAERNLPAPSAPQPGWIALAETVFNLQVMRWDQSSCGGGLRWVIQPFQHGYDYKDATSQAALFLLAARLAKFTNNATYADWATKAYDWTSNVGIITNHFDVFDGTQTATNCSSINRIQWSYNAAAFMYGSAVMYSYTNSSQQWQKRTASFASAMAVFYPQRHPDIMTEVACEPVKTCDIDQKAFKALASQWIGATIQQAPFTNNTLSARLRASAVGSAKACPDSTDEAKCGFQWTMGKSDMDTGLGPQLGAMNVIVANLAANSKASMSTATASGGSQTSSSSPSKSSTASDQPAKATSGASLSTQLSVVEAFCMVFTTISMLL